MKSEYISLFFLGLFCITTVLAYLPIQNSFSFSRFMINLIIVLLIIVIPLFTFLASAFLTPEWKGGAPLGAYSLFFHTKIYLLPFVLWAMAALYIIEVVKIKNTDRYSIILGLFSGVVVSTLIFIFAIIDISVKENILVALLMMAIAGPGYVPIWFAIRFWKLCKKSQLNKVAYLITVLGQLPFWWYSIQSAQQGYITLTDKAPDCFIATASAQGYPFIVGEQTIHWHNGRNVYASKQMLRLWRFETIWSTHSPHSHKVFRIYYNCYGSALAKHINTPFKASLSYILLKPVEWILLLLYRVSK